MNPKFQNRGEKDLFDQFQTADKKIRQKTNILLPAIKKSLSLSYENVIFLVIGFVMCCIIFFTLGVEKGRKDIGRAGEKAIVNLSAKDRQEILKAQPRLRQIKEKEIKTELTASYQHTKDERQEMQGESYTVQLAAFKGKDSAERERAELKKIGYDAYIKQSGYYYQLYIGGFRTKKDAQNLANKLKNKYNDCYVKRVSE